MIIDDIRKEKATNLRQQRLDAGLTQVKLAKLSGMKLETIKKLESAKSGWSVNTEILYTSTISKYAQQNKL